MVDFVLLVDATITDKDILIEIIANQTDFNIGGFNVDRDSIRLSGKFDSQKCPSSGRDNLAVRVYQLSRCTTLAHNYPNIPWCLVLLVNISMNNIYKISTHQLQHRT